MANNFSQRVLVKVIAQICQMFGFEKAMTSPLYILADILQEFILNLGKLSQHYAEHCGRLKINLCDLSLAFHDCGVDPNELVEFLRAVSPLPQSLPIPKYPVAAMLSMDLDQPDELNTIPLEYDQPNDQTSPQKSRDELKIKISLRKIKEARKAKKDSKCRKIKKKKKSKEK